MLKLITYKAPKQLLWVSDEEIKEGELCLYNSDLITRYSSEYSKTRYRKIHAQTNLNLEGVPHIKMPEEKTAEQVLRMKSSLWAYMSKEPKWWLDDILSAMEEYASLKVKELNEGGWSNEEMRRAFDAGHTLAMAEYRDKRTLISFDDVLKSLTHTIVGAEPVMERVEPRVNNIQGEFDEDDVKLVPKTYTDKDGLTYIEVKFIYG